MHAWLQICSISFYLFNLDRDFDGMEQMNLTWVNRSSIYIQEISFGANREPQSDSNWNTSVFRYDRNYGCEDCEHGVLTLNFKLEV